MRRMDSKSAIKPVPSLSFQGNLTPCTHESVMLSSRILRPYCTLIEMLLNMLKQK